MIPLVVKVLNLVCIIGDVLVLTTNSRTYAAAVSCLNTKVIDIHIPPRKYIDTKHVFTQLLRQMHFYTN